MPAPIHVHGFETSNNMKVRVALGFKRLPYEFHAIDPVLNEVLAPEEYDLPCLAQAGVTELVVTEATARKRTRATRIHKQRGRSSTGKSVEVRQTLLMLDLNPGAESASRTERGIRSVRRRNSDPSET